MILRDYALDTQWSSEPDASCCESLQVALKAGGLCSPSGNGVTNLATEATDVQKANVE